jgi:hypothetical protein
VRKPDEAGLLALIAADGRPLLQCTALALLFSGGFALFLSSRSLRQALALAGLAGFGAAIGVHVVVGYTDALHLAPAVAGAALFVVGLVLVSERRPREEETRWHR